MQSRDVLFLRDMSIYISYTHACIMGNTILLTGNPGSGKTTIIMEIINGFSGKMGGFYTEEMREGGLRTGFRMITLHGRTGILAHVNNKSSLRVGKYGVDLPALEEIGVRSVYGALKDEALVVIDEIGSMEIASEKFRRAVQDVIQSDCTLLATIVKRSLPFTDGIKRTCSNIIEVSHSSRENIASQILFSLSEGRKR